MASNAAVKYGLIAGIGTIAYFLLFYFIDKELLFNPFVYWVPLGFYLALMWRALQAGEQGQVPGFRDALRTAFLVFVVANFLYYLFYYLLYSLIDPGLIDLQREAMRESLDQQGHLLSEEQREELLESLKDGRLAPTVSGVFFTFVRSLIGGFVAALGMAALWGRRGMND